LIKLQAASDKPATLCQIVFMFKFGSLFLLLPIGNRRRVRLNACGSNTITERIKIMSKYYGLQVCKLTFLKVDENGDSIDDKEYEYTGDHSGFCDGIHEDYLEEVKKNND
jgi:hypothetical protein